MKKERRWLKSAIASAAECTTTMPFQRAAKRKGAAIKVVALRPAVAAR